MFLTEIVNINYQQTDFGWLLKKNTMNLGARFDVLRNHTALVVTISEEKQIHEANLKLIMARVNGMCQGCNLHIVLI